MKMRIAWREFLISTSAVAVVAALASSVLGLAFLPVFGLTLAAVFANGLLATLEDDLPGGFNNPDGSDTPAYVRRVFLGARWGLAGLVLLFGVAFLAAGLSAAPDPFVFGVATACALLALALVRKRFRLVYLALAVSLAGVAISAALR